jgi:hypothetical protein
MGLPSTPQKSGFLLVFTQIGKRSLLLDDSAFWEGIALVELEARVEDVVREPNRGEGVQQPLVKVIRHSSPILDLVKTDNYHVKYAKIAYVPRNDLHLIFRYMCKNKTRVKK